MFDYLYTLQSFIIYLVQNTGFLHPLYEQRHAPLSNPLVSSSFITPFRKNLKFALFIRGTSNLFLFNGANIGVSGWFGVF